MKNKPSKSAKPQVKIRDIKPQKDARGGKTADPCEGGERVGGIKGIKGIK